MSVNFPFWTFFSAVAFVAALGAPVQANQLSSEHLTARLVSELDVIAPGDTATVAVYQQIAPGWHTYWRNAGDSGQAPVIEWSVPAGVTIEPTEWPAPHRIEYGPLVNFGYSHEAALLFDLKVPADWPVGQPLPVRAEAEILVCSEICIPVSGQLAIDLPVGSASQIKTDVAAIFASARNAQPIPSPWPVEIYADQDRLSLKLQGPASDFINIERGFLFPEAWGVIAHAAPQRMTISETGLMLSVPRGDVPPNTGFSGVVTLSQKNGPDRSFVLTDAPVTRTTVKTGGGIQSEPAQPLLVLVGLALLGGLLLNLMPCVFPVLAVKAIGLAKQKDEPARVRAMLGGSYTLGVVVSFLVLAGVLLALRAGGAVIGWGFQLQDPLIVGVLAYILMAVGLNFSGVFDIGNRLSQLGGSVSTGQGAIGSFATGVLATLVAAPCTAPFMATAIGGALVLPPPATLTVFASLGFGLALPYLAISLAPGLAQRLPKPGAWMITFKQFLAFPMYISVAWLVWVLSQQAGIDAAFLVTIGLIGLAFAAWAWPVDWQTNGRVMRTVRMAIVALPLAGVLGSLFWLNTVMDAPVAEAVEGQPSAEVFSEGRLKELVNDGRPVLVNMTAAWCITCKVNERVALSGQRFEDLLARSGVTYMKGDWTNKDDEITRFLERFGRLGVPLYVFYPGNGQAPKVLPQVLSPGMVETELSTMTISQL